MQSPASRFFNLVIRNDRELGRFVLRVSVACALAALTVDVINQFVFFVSWPDAARSWVVTVLLATAIAFPVSRAVGKAHLELFRAKAEVELLSRTDELTGLLNRRALMKVADTEHPDTMVLVIADIDRFKSVNDSHGHLAGDAVIRLVSRLAHEELGPLGHLGRIGGEEFALLCSHASPAEVATRLERLRERIAATPAGAGDTAIRVTISAGAALRGAGRSFDDLYADADRALYEAKALGRNRIVCSPRFMERVDEGGAGPVRVVPVEARRPSAAPATPDRRIV